MKTQQFFCPENGTGTSIVEINIPTCCPSCSSPIRVEHNAHDRSNFLSFPNMCCRVNFGTYLKVWNMRIIDNDAGISKPVVASVGATCSRCKEFNSYAEPNRPNNVFICYSCRS